MSYQRYDPKIARLERANQRPPHSWGRFRLRLALLRIEKFILVHVFIRTLRRSAICQFAIERHLNLTTPTRDWAKLINQMSILIWRGGVD